VTYPQQDLCPHGLFSELSNRPYAWIEPSTDGPPHCNEAVITRQVWGGRVDRVKEVKEVKEVRSNYS
jgi:hypothetical protein